ncbi:hypothetical protein O3G_MSEX002401 [Manduca sexta]|uniref:Actin maturation protease n=1 Tax=Manduca sexta TaxID=7130 RepID=A0A922CD44_MANSE|nr:hypothetical protein O3G_MSEX002401 [Manduca sexta]
MCTIPPAPPPPPPPQITSDINANIETQRPNDAPTITFDPDSCVWASEHLELREACIKNSICIYKAPFKFKYKYIESIIQVGPTCGLVAMSMLANGQVPPSEMLNISKQEGYTCNGEMFSCKNMVKLAEKVFNLVNVGDVSYTLEYGGLFSSRIIEKLLNGAILLVPYDADCNHSPCLRNGHTAHWALICGVIIVDDPGDTYESDPRNVYVLCKHGKSKYLTVWNLADLERSNKNLMEFSPKKGADGLTYILPVGGIGGDDGLRNQFLIFEGL